MNGKSSWPSGRPRIVHTSGPAASFCLDPGFAHLHMRLHFSDSRSALALAGIRSLVVHIKTDHTVRTRHRIVPTSGAAEAYEAHTLSRLRGSHTRGPAGSNRIFQLLDLHLHSPQSGDVWYTSRRITL